MISALDSGASARGSGPAGDIVSCSWACHFTVTVPLSKEVYKWVPANLLLRGYPCDGLASHPGSRNDTGISPGLMNHLARIFYSIESLQFR